MWVSCRNLFEGFSLNRLLFLSTLHFVGIRVFIMGYEMECEKSFFSKIRCTGESLVTGMSCEFQSPDNRMARLNFLSCSDPAVLTLQLPTYITRMPHSSESPLTSQSRDPVTCCHLMHTIDQLFTLSHTSLTSCMLHTCATFWWVTTRESIARSNFKLPLDTHTWSILHTLSHTTLTLYMI